MNLAEILEDDWDRQLFRGPKSLAAATGWSSYHTLRSKGSKSGYPDRTAVRERIIFVELKREKTKPTQDQVEWLDRLSAAGGECYLWRPSDLEEIGLILGKRWMFVPHDSNQRAATPALASASTLWWQPNSIWIPKIGRHDSVEKSPQLRKQASPMDKQQLFA